MQRILHISNPAVQEVTDESFDIVDLENALVENNCAAAPVASFSGQTEALNLFTFPSRAGCLGTECKRHFTERTLQLLNQLSMC